MKKDELTKEIARRLDIKVTDALAMVNAFIETLTDSLMKGESIELRGLGVFKPIDTKPRKGFDISRHKSVDIPSQKAVKFKASKTLKEKLARQ